jgi:hypothetical protein
MKRTGESSQLCFCVEKLKSCVKILKESSELIVFEKQILMRKLSSWILR